MKRIGRGWTQISRVVWFTFSGPVNSFLERTSGVPDGTVALLVEVTDITGTDCDVVNCAVVVENGTKKNKKTSECRIEVIVGKFCLGGCSKKKMIDTVQKDQFWETGPLIAKDICFSLFCYLPLSHTESGLMAEGSASLHSYSHKRLQAYSVKVDH